MKSEKFRNFYKTVPLKLFVLLAAIVLIAFFSNDFGLVDIQKTAVILAVGLDKEDENYTVTAQIAVPKGSDRTTGGTSSVEITGEGRTVADGFGQIYAKTGWVPKLVFCNLIVVGEETAKKDVFAVLFRILCPCFVSVPEWADGRERGVPQWGKDPWGRVLIKREKTRKNGKSAALRRNG